MTLTGLSKSKYLFSPSSVVIGKQKRKAESLTSQPSPATPSSTESSQTYSSTREPYTPKSNSREDHETLTTVPSLSVSLLFIAFNCVFQQLALNLWSLCRILILPVITFCPLRMEQPAASSPLSQGGRGKPIVEARMRYSFLPSFFLLFFLRVISIFVYGVVHFLLKSLFKIYSKCHVSLHEVFFSPFTNLFSLHFFHPFIPIIIM